MLASHPTPIPQAEAPSISFLPAVLTLQPQRRSSLHKEMERAFPSLAARNVPLPAGIPEMLQSIASRILGDVYRGNKDLLKQVLFDANILALSPPCTNEDPRKTLFFGTNTYQAILKTILEHGSIEQSDLEYLHTHRYCELNAPQRFLLLMLYPLKRSLRRVFLGSEHGSRLLRHSGLAYWLTHSPYLHVQQTMLNTCIGTVFAQQCLAHAPTLLALLPMAEHLFNRLRILATQASPSLLAREAWNNGPTLQSILEERFEDIQQQLKDWSAALSLALRTPASRLNFKELAAQGNSCLELIFSCANIAHPNWGEDHDGLLTLNSPYLFRRKWNLSSALTCIKQGWQRLLRRNIPTLKERYHRGYVCYEGCKALLRETITLPGLEEESILTFPAGKRPSTSELQSLWTHIAQTGSCRLERPGHAALLRAYSGEKSLYFLLDDPMKPHGEWLNIEATADRFTQQEIILFLEKSGE